MACEPFVIRLPSGDRIAGNREVMDYPLRISRRSWPSKGIFVDANDENLILGDDCLDMNETIMNYYTRGILMLSGDGIEHTSIRRKRGDQNLISNALKVMKLLRIDCIGYWCYAM